MFEGKVNPNILSLTDTALTLIVAFLITLPAVVWRGMDVNAEKTSAGINKTVETDDGVLIVSISRRAVYINGSITAVSRLKKRLTAELAKSKSGEIIIVPDGDVMLDRVVKIFDIAKIAGAKKLTLIDKGTG
ncbi:MAG: biopolymer transporter ExbD [Elusimicrobia bacterium]|nr:biopolymer transporter ExbD [Elusimicrobiota bacterium]